MPSISRTVSGPGGSVKSRMSRVWYRNGKGPYVPHEFTFTCAQVLRDVPGDTNINWSVNSGGAGTLTGDANVLENELYVKLRSKAYTQFQGGAFVGQLGQTLTMLGDLTRAVRSPMKTLGGLMRRASRNKRGVPVLKDVSEGILLFNYGIKTFMQDMYDLMTVLQRPYPRFKVKASVTQQQLVAYVPATGTSRTRSSVEVRATATLSGGFTMVVTNPNLFAAEQMGLLNPASIAWELFPFSFVVDWFLQIGDYFNSWSDYAGVSQEKGWKTAYTKAFGSRSYPGLNAYCTDMSCTCKRTTAVPRFVVRNMSLNLKQSVTHVVNGISLILANARSR